MFNTDSEKQTEEQLQQPLSVVTKLFPIYVNNGK